MTSKERWDRGFWDNHSCQNEICDTCWGRVERLRKTLEELLDWIAAPGQDDEGSFQVPSWELYSRARRSLEGNEA